MKIKIKNEIIKRYQLKKDQESIIIKLIDKASLCENKDIIKDIDFVDPYLAFIAEEILNNHFNIKFQILGGYEAAERKIIIMFPDYVDEDNLDIPLKVIKICINNYNNINHRDVLGAILGLGLKREKIGDIIINDELIQVIVKNEVVDFILLHLQQIGRCNVKPEVVDISKILPKKEEFKYINGNVTSLRLDSICSVGFKESRSISTRNIKNDRVKVNFKPVNSPSYQIKEGDVISYRGKGRIFLEEIIGKTKKERYKVLIKKII